MPVWIIVQTSREEIFEKGFWRIIGTLLGAALSIIIAISVESTFLKIILISIILGLTSGLNEAFRGLNGYGLQMLGITVGAIVIAGLIVTSLYIYFPRPYLKLAKEHKDKFLKTNSTKALFEYLLLLKLAGSPESAYQNFVDEFSSP